MNRFEPLGYVAASTTIWHLVVALALVAIAGILAPLSSGNPIRWTWLPFGCIGIATIYALFALLFGQVFGDRYPLAMIWPSGLAVGALFSSLPFLQQSIFADGRADPPPAWFAGFGILIGANFFAFALWLLPRIIGFGLVDFPKYSWGVQV